MQINCLTSMVCDKLMHVYKKALQQTGFLSSNGGGGGGGGELPLKPPSFPPKNLT